MLIHRNEMKVELKENMREGTGTVTMTHLMDCSGQKNIRILAELNLPPGASIGNHKHDDETEYFIVLSGSGVAGDDGAEKHIKAGDVLATGNGASHSIKNTGTAPLIMHAIIVTY